MPEAVSPRTARLLKDITGETNLDAAVLTTLADALEHRMRSIEDDLETYQERYGMSFDEFREAWGAGEVEEKHSLDVERDYREWEGLVTRRKKIQEALSWIR